MCMMNWACIPKQTSCNHCLSSLSATQVTTLRLKQPSCFCSVAVLLLQYNPSTALALVVSLFHTGVSITQQSHDSNNRTKTERWTECKKKKKKKNKLKKVDPEASKPQ